MATPKPAMTGDVAEMRATRADSVLDTSTTENQMATHSMTGSLERARELHAAVTANQGRELRTVVKVLLTVFLSALVLTLAFGDNARAKWGMITILGGLLVATYLIYDAHTRSDSLISSILLYVGGFGLLAEIIFFLNGLLAHAASTAS